MFILQCLKRFPAALLVIAAAFFSTGVAQAQDCSSSMPASGVYTGYATGYAWGDNNQGYSSDSNVGFAAVHAGLLAPGASGHVTVTSLGTVSSFTGSTANGVTTSSYGSPWCGMRLSGGNSPTPAPTITVTRTPSPMVAGQSYTVNWNTTNATSFSFTCTAAGTGFAGSSTVALNGSSTGIANAAWVDYPSTCIWTATGPGGTKTYTETLNTQVGAPPADECLASTPASGVYTGAPSGYAWGNNNQGYSSDSNIGFAAVHAGLLAPGASGNITITSLGTLSSFTGTTANGVTTSSYGSPWCAMRLSGGNPPTPAPTITVTRTPSPMVAGQSYTLNWSTTGATALSYTCTSTGTGYAGSSGALTVNGSSTGTAQAGWVGYPSTCTWTATGAGGTKTYTETMTTQAAAAPTITVTRTPSPMVAGQSYTLNWSTTGATALSYTCTSTGTGYAGSSGVLSVNGSSTGTAQAGWVGYPSTCTWTATGAGGIKTYTETMTTQAGAPPGGVIYFHNDVSGSPLAATDASGNVLWKESYRPYGERVANSSTATANNKLWFTGKPQDAQTGLSYMGARYYDSILGRFTGIDSVDFQEGNLHSFNRYAYGNNNPYRYVDPDGRHPILVGMGIGAVIGGVSAAFSNAAMQYLDTGSFSAIQVTGYGSVTHAMMDGALWGAAFGAVGAGQIGAAAGAASGGRSAAAKGGAASAKQAADLSKHLGYAEKYGKGGVKELENGRIRYYGEVQPANKAGEMAGRRYVHEYDAATGRSRGWHETVDQAGNVRQVRPELNNGSKTHYQFDRNGNYTGSW